MSTLRAGATSSADNIAGDSDGNGSDSGSSSEAAAITAGAAAAAAAMAAADEFRAKATAEGLPADTPLPAWFLRDVEDNKAKAEESEREKEKEGVRASNPFLQQGGLPKFESITPEAATPVKIDVDCGRKRRLCVPCLTILTPALVPI